MSFLGSVCPSGCVVRADACGLHASVVFVDLDVLLNVAGVFAPVVVRVEGVCDCFMQDILVANRRLEIIVRCCGNFLTELREPKRSTMGNLFRSWNLHLVIWIIQFERGCHSVCPSVMRSIVCVHFESFVV